MEVRRLWRALGLALIVGFCLTGVLAPVHAAGTPPLPGRLATQPLWTHDGVAYAPEAALLGLSVAGTGDVDGDGYADLVIGAPGSSLGCCQAGRVFVFHGADVGPGDLPDWIAGGPTDVAGYGAGVGPAGDVDGDGYDDLIFTGSFAGGPNSAVLYRGSAAGLSNIPAWSITLTPAATFWPLPATSAGDVNGDGYDDVIIGHRAFNAEVPGEGQGRALVFHGSAAGLSNAAAWTVTGSVAGESLGFSVAAAGDVNRDGFGDVLVANHVEARLYLGSAEGLGTTTAWSAVMQPVLGPYFSYGEVASAGDVDGDGYDDVLVGSAGFANGQIQEGRVVLYRGSTAGLSATPSWTVESDRAQSYFGCSVASAGDVDADGHPDVIVGDCTSRGRAFIFLGGPGGPATTPAWMVEGSSDGANFGRSVRGAGDVNGDGRDDVIIGAPGGDGEAFLFLGVPAASTGPAATVPDGADPLDSPLTLRREADGSVVLAWGVSCVGTEMDWIVYEGLLGDFTSHVPVHCTTGGQRAARLTSTSGDTYYLVVPRTLDFEGSLGPGVGGLERPAGLGACLPQSVIDCP